MNKAGVFIGLGFELLGAVLGALYVGSEIDKYFNWPGYAVAGLIVAMIFGWIYHVIYLLKKFMDDTKDDQPGGTS